MGPTLVALGLFAALTVFHTWPLTPHATGAIYKSADTMSGFSSLNGLSDQLVRDPANLLDGNFFYPFSHTLAVLDHQVAGALLIAPVKLAGASGVLAYNLFLLAAFVLNGFFTFLLVRHITGSFAGGLVAGCGFAFGGYHAHHIAQPHIFATQWIPLALLLLLRYFKHLSFGRWAAFAVATLLVALSSWHVAVFGGLTIAIVGLWSLPVTPRDRKRCLAGMVAAALLCCVALLPLAYEYVAMARQWPPRTGDGRETAGTLTTNSVNLLGLLTPASSSRAPYADLLPRSDHNGPGIFPGVVLIGLALPALTLFFRRRERSGSPTARIVRGALLASGALAAAVATAAAAGARGDPVVALLRPIGPFVLLGLSLIAAAVLAARRDPDDDPRVATLLPFMVLAAAGVLLSLGPRVMLGAADLGSGLWRMELLPVPLLVRAPARLSFLLALGIAVLSGIGTACLLQRLTPRRVVAATVALLILLNADLVFRALPMYVAPMPAAVDAWLAELPDDGAVIEYPLQDHWWAVYSSQLYGRRIVNGMGYLFPWEYREMERYDDLSPEQLAVLWEHFHPRFVVLRTDQYRPAKRRAVLARVAAQPDALHLRGRFGGDYVYELIDRGRDSELYRRWPLEALAGRSVARLGATVAEGRAGTVSRLGIALNGEPLLPERQWSVAPQAGGYRLPGIDERLLPGLNVFALWGDYRITDTSQAHDIGSTGVRLAADVSVRSDRERARVQINGRVIRPDKGYFLAELDAETGRIRRMKQFNVSWFPESSDALAAFVRDIPEGTPVIVATEFDASRQLQESAVTALAELGLEIDLRGRFQLLHAAIGVKGARPGSALEVTDWRQANLVLGEPELREVQIQSFDLGPRND